MARAIEKGATYLDKMCHKLYDEPKYRGEKTDYVCRLCGGPLETYYCEERLYLVDYSQELGQVKRRKKLFSA